MSRALALGVALAMAGGVRATPLVVTCQRQGYPLVERTIGYLGRYVDQPLCLDPDINPANPFEMSISQADYELQQQEAIRYGIDGFVLFTGGWRRLGYIESGVKKPVGDFFSAPILDWWTHPLNATDERAFELAMNDPKGFKLDGRRVFFQFNTDDHHTPQAVKEKMSYLEGKYGGGNILFVEIGKMADGRLRDAFNRNGDLGAEQAAAFKEHLRGYLRVADGIMTGGTHMQRYRDEELSRRTLDVKFLRRMLGLIRETMAEPEFAEKKKYLAMQMIVGYENCYDHGSNVSSDGLNTLLSLFELVREFKPDVLKFSEWDEFNECTCIGPTLSNGFVTRRLIRNFLDDYRTGTVRPQEGDDLSVPNLVISYRKTISPGEPLTVDVLNIADGSGSGLTQVAVRVCDETGRVVETFPTRTLEASKTAVTRYLLRTDRLEARALTVELRYRTADGRTGRVSEGLHPVDFALANSWDEKSVNHALRDLPTLTVAKTEMSDAGEISAELSCAEPIRYAMVEGGSEMLYIHNPEDRIERFRETDEAAVFHVSFLSWLTVPAADRRFSLTLPGVPEAEWIRERTISKGETYKPGWLSMSTEPVYLRIPKAKLSEAKMAVDLHGEKFGPLLKGEIPLQAAHRLGAYSLGGPTGSTQVCVAQLNRQASYPSVWNKKDVRFSVKCPADRQSMMYNVVVVTMSGKVWRSRPFCTGGRPHERVLDYDFSPQAGDLVLPKSGERWYFGRLGDYFSPATLRNRGYSTSDATHQMLRHGEQLGDMRPARMRDEQGGWALSFDGQDDLVAFPWETIPRFGPWEVSFEFKPDDIDRRQMMLTTRRAGGNASLSTLEIFERGIRIGFCDFIGAGRNGWSGVQSPRETISAGVWNTVRLCHTGTALELTVNGQTFAKPSSLPGAYMTTTILGGVDGMRYKGLIRNLRIIQKRRE